MSTVLDLVLSNATVYLIELMHCKHRVALNVEHHTERIGLLTLIVLGEMCFALLFDSQSRDFSNSYITTGFGALIAVSLQRLYFTVDNGKQVGLVTSILLSLTCHRNSMQMSDRR